MGDLLSFMRTNNDELYTKHVKHQTKTKFIRFN